MDDIPVRELGMDIFIVDVERHNQMSNLGSSERQSSLIPSASVMLRDIPDQASHPSSGSLARGILTNLLSPHPYLFWLSVGGAYLTKAPGVVAQALFLVGFYTCLIGVKVLLAIYIGHSRTFLTGTPLKWLFKVLGVLLGVLAAGLLWEGSAYLGMRGLGHP